MVFFQCWKVVQYVGNLGSSIGNDSSRSYRLCFPNVGKLYSMLGTYVPMLENFNPDLGKSVDCPFPIFESCTMNWEPMF